MMHGWGSEGGETKHKTEELLELARTVAAHFQSPNDPHYSAMSHVLAQEAIYRYGSQQEQRQYCTQSRDDPDYTAKLKFRG